MSGLRRLTAAFAHLYDTDPGEASPMTDLELEVERKTPEEATHMKLLDEKMESAKEQDRIEAEFISLSR